MNTFNAFYVTATEGSLKMLSHEVAKLEDVLTLFDDISCTDIKTAVVEAGVLTCVGDNRIVVASKFQNEAALNFVLLLLREKCFIGNLPKPKVNKITLPQYLAEFLLRNSVDAAFFNVDKLAKRLSEQIKLYKQQYS